MEDRRGARCVRPSRVGWALALLVTAALPTDLAAQQQPGAAGQTAGAAADEPKNPFEINEDNVAEGRRLYMRFNCYGCHGTQGGGGMGPSLIDQQWRYGSKDGDLLESIVEGRPNGMPPFGQSLKEEEAWKIIVYVRSLQRGG